MGRGEFCLSAAWLLRLLLSTALVAFGLACPASAADADPAATCLDANVADAAVSRDACQAWLRDHSLAPAQEASARGNLAWALRDIGDLDSAWREADLSTAASPAEPTGYEVRAAMLHQLRRTPEAREQIDKALKLEPTYRGYLTSARIYGALQQYDAAIAHDDAAIALQPRWSPAYVDRGVNHWSKREYDLALRDYRLAEAIDPTSTVISFNIANVLILLNRDDEAMLSLGQTLKAEPRNAGAIKMRGYVHARAGRLDAALEDYEAAVRLSPEDADAILGVALTQSHLGRYDAALATTEKAVRLDPENPDGFDMRGWIRAVHGRDLPLAIADVETAVRMAPDNAEYRADLAFAKFKAGLLDAAARDADAAVALDGTDAGAVFLRGYIRSARNATQDARDDLAAAVKLDPNVVSRFARQGIRYP